MAKYIPGRTGQQCAQRWRHRVNPNIKKEKWTPEEDRLLVRLVHQHGSAWAEISRGLEVRPSSARSSYSGLVQPAWSYDARDAWCIKQRLTRACMMCKPRQLAQPEHQQLIPGRCLAAASTVWRAGPTADIRHAFERQGRTDQQCMGRWRRHLDPKVKRDLWSPQEDARLTQLVGQLGAQWSRICRHVKHRTAQQCRARCASGR